MLQLKHKLTKETRSLIKENLLIEGQLLGKVMLLLIDRLNNGEIILQDDILIEAKIALAEINGNIKDLNS